jgi:hypothetical protein
MKKSLMVLGHLRADTKRESKDRCQWATVVTVDKRYESATAYLPSAFSPNHAGRRAASETRYVGQPARDGDREVKMKIVGRSRLKENGWVTN